MRFAVVLAIILAIAFCDITCATNQVYVKIKKQTASMDANEESFTISNGGTVLYTSPVFANNELRILETCLTASTNNQYTLTLKDSYGDAWRSGSWLEVMGKEGNIVYKGYLVDSYQEAYTISLYEPIIKGAQWKFSSGSVTGNWFDTTFPDAGWSVETLGTTTATASGTQYFRINFAGLANMAAYELSMNYKYGIVAYINGAEIFRDNMADGVVSSSTYATGSYPALTYRSIIRPGSEVTNTNSLLAVELHFTSGVTQTNIDFNAFLAIYASSNANTNCYAYPYSVTMSTTGTGTVNNAWDWAKWSYMYNSLSTPITITATLNPNYIPFVNGIRFFPYSFNTYTPSVYTLSGSMSLTSAYQPIITNGYRTYTANTWDVRPTLFYGRFSRYVQLSVTSSNSGNYMYLPEMTTVTCNNGDLGTIPFSAPSYTFYGIYEEVTIRPAFDEFTSCSIQPSPSAGLTFDGTTCTLSGKGTAASSATYTVTSIVQGQTFTGTFSLTIEMCAGSILDVRRITKANSYSEGYTIKDVATNQVIISQTINGDQLDNQDFHTIICCSGTKYRIDMEGALNYWYPYSFVFLYLVLSDDENEMIGRYNMDNILGTPTSYVFNTHYEFTPLSNWFYKMSEVPLNWFNSETSGWTEGNSSNFVAPTNQIQLYKKNVVIGSLGDIAGFTVSLRFQYGCVMYINNQEVYRYGVTGDVSTTSFATTSYSSVMFRSVTLPIATMALDATTPSKTYLQTGSNTIAIALVAQNGQQTTVSFDAALRLLGSSSSNRVFMHSNSGSGISYSQQSSDPFVSNHLRSIYYTTCSTNYLDIYFSNDRKEWISSLVLQNWYEKNEQNVAQFNILAKNDDMSEYVLIKEVTGLKWSYAGQEKRIWLQNNKPYNRYRFQNFGTGNPSACAWRINRISMYSDSLATVVPALTYTTPVVIFKDVEMAEVYPSSDLYSDFTITPNLPAGITIDPNTGMISGTASQQSGATTYVITARKYNTYETVTAQFSLEVTVCTGGKSLITMTIRTDSNPDQGAYKIYSGKGTSGQVVSQVDGFPRKNNLYYADFCLNHGIYTAEAISNAATGWAQPAGFMFSVDIGTLRFEVGQVPAGTAPVRVTSMFSSYLPFQVEYDDWKIYKETTAVPTTWNTVDFVEDAAWQTAKAADFGTSEAITVYVRKTIPIDDINNYQVLNVRIKYAGGIVAFFNGRKVARFNLADEYTSSTESITVHNSMLFSKFHVILSTAGGQSGTNVIAFEIHRPRNQASSTNIEFDATGVFGVNDCSVVVDTYTSLSGTDTTGATIQELFELAPYNSGYITNVVGSYIEWIVENLEGSKFNSFGMEVPQDAAGYGFSLYGYTELEGNDRTSIVEVVSQSFTNRQRKAFDAPVGIAGFRRYRFETDVASTTPVYVATYLTQYCKASGSGGCSGVGDYPAVAEGQISPSSCGEGFRGYSYRRCASGQLGEVQTDKCVHKLPAYLTYAEKRYSFVKDAENETDAPTYVNIITKFYLEEGVSLPEGLTLDETTGKIKGKPVAEASIKTYTVYGMNPTGVTYTTISFNVRVGECKADGVWETTQVGVTASYDCSLKGNYKGSQTRTCVLGARDGEWQKTSGMCIATSVIYILVVVVIVIIIVLIVVIKNKTSKNPKAKGKSSNTKGKKVVKKSSSGTKSNATKAAAKNVKV